MGKRKKKCWPDKNKTASPPKILHPDSHLQRTIWWRRTTVRLWGTIGVIATIVSLVGFFALQPSVDVAVSEIRSDQDPLSIDFTLTNSSPYAIYHVYVTANPKQFGTTTFVPRLRMTPMSWGFNRTLQRHEAVSLPLNDVMTGYSLKPSNLAGEMIIQIEYRKFFVHFDQKFGFKLQPDKYGKERWMRFSLE